MSNSDVLDIEGGSAPVLVTDEDGRLYYEGKRTALSRFDRSYVAAAASAYKSGRDIALIYPSPPSYVQIPVLLAVGFQARGSTPPALFVSNRTGIREQYFKLGLGPRHQPGDDIEPEPLGHFTAPMVKTGDGSRLSYITGHKPQNWDPDNPFTASLVHTTFGKKIANTLSEDLRLSGLLLDFTTGLLDDRSTQETYRYLAEERDIPRIMVFDSPNHPYLDRLEENNDDRDTPILFWGWSPSALESAPEELLHGVADDSHLHGQRTASDGGSLPSPFTDAQNSLQNIRQGISRSIVPLTYGDLEPVARETYQLIGEAARFPKGTDDEYSGESNDVIGSTYFLYMYLDTLPTSVDFHDSLSALDDSRSWGASNTLEGKVDRLRSRAEVLERDVPGAGPMLEDACDGLEQMIELLTVHNPKADTIAEQIRTARDEDKKVTILTATRKQESLLRSFVAEKTEFSRHGALEDEIKFHSLYNPHTVPESDVLIFPGVPTRSHYATVQSGAAPQQQFLSYKWETDRLEKRLRDVSETADWRAGPSVQYGTAKELQIETEGLRRYVSEAEPRTPRPRTYSDRQDEIQSGQTNIETEKTSSGGRSKPSADRIGASHTISPDDISIDLQGLSSDGDPDEFWEEELSYDDGSERETIDEGRSDVTSASGEEGYTDALKVEFVDGDYMFEEPSGLVWALVDGKRGVSRERRSTASLERGDQLLLIEDDSRRDVFEHVVEKIHSECRGQFQRYLSMLDLWTTGIDHVVEFWRDVENAHNEDPSQPMIDLTRHRMAELIEEDLEEYAHEHDEPDVTRGAQAIYNWLTKSTIGPSSPAPIRALGELYDVEVLKGHSKEIFAGLEEVRSLHVRVGNKLGSIVFSAHDADSDEWLLEECGLRVSDVQDATVAKTVESVSTETYEVEAGKVGKVVRGD
ncbi:DISARM anti-phage system protein DrmE domain-containing protein [Haloarcula amylolytica]|uniref:DISARM anti-phage system protein DrmE domain-containing protein n=1 Tax=Haloarcula amylolytica TaxID=396317 RepID=UPI000677FC18|nr:hypothetical protein [Haloarcula amylolytica]